MRALQGSGWQKSEQHFRAYAGAVTKYASWQLEGVRRGDLQPRELSSVRLLLRGTIKQVRPALPGASDFKPCSALMFIQERVLT